MLLATVKMVRNPGDPAERRKMAQALNVEEDFLKNLKKVDTERNSYKPGYAEWACKEGDRATEKVRVDFGLLETKPTLMKAEYQAFLEKNRERYCSGGRYAKKRVDIRKPADKDTPVQAEDASDAKADEVIPVKLDEQIPAAQGFDKQEDFWS
jgi:hypothetical protein